MEAYLDSAIGDNPKLLQDLLRSLNKERDALEKQLSGVGSLEGGSDWLKVTKEVRETIGEFENLQSSATSIQQAELTRGACASEEGVESVSREGVECEVDACVRALQPLVEELGALERAHSYLAWIKQINLLCQSVEGHLTSGLLSEALSSYMQLASLAVTMETSSCSNLRHFALSSKQHWNSRLTKKLSSDFGVILKDLQWPFTTSSLSSKALDAWNKSKKKFIDIFSQLIKIDDRIFPTDKPAAQLSDPLLSPLELLVEPLRKRFKYHFFGQRKTNSKEKPEWYLTQVSNWIRDHSHFLEDKIQPLLTAAGLSHIDARVEFIRGLLQEVEAKLQTDLPEIVYEDTLMSHLIDELLIFEHELREVLQYPHPFPTPFDVLLGEVPFHKWLSLEKAFAIERINTIVLSESAWQPAYDGIANADDTRVPQCTENIMELIKGITDRYSSLTSVRHQLSFLELQRDLLLELHHDLCVNSEAQLGSDPLHPQLLAYLNACHYITTVLGAWGEQMFFLELHYHTKTNVETDPRPPPLNTIRLLRRQDPDFTASEGSAFSVVVEAFSSLVERLKQDLVGAVLARVKDKLYRYKKEKWHSMAPAGKDELARDVTQSTVELTALLREHLLFIQEQLSPLLSSDVFDKILTEVDKAIFTEVVLASHFSEGGAEQLHFDLTTALQPLLSKFANELSRRQLMERTMEACKLLLLLPGSIKLMLALLQEAVKTGTVHEDAYSEAVTALNDMGVHNLDPARAEQVLRLRILSA